jgi:NAD(P)-dependent dehydrogenase (short-subunit alcohol dehydrogenase family)
MEFSMASTSSSSKVALVTGASSGMGKETAKRLLQEGLVVYVAARRIDQMEDLRALGAIPLKMDITVEEDVVAAVKQVQAMHGGIDVLVNNAGFGMYGSMEESTIDDARYQFDVNLFGMARLTQLALPAMRKKGHHHQYLIHGRKDLYPAGFVVPRHQTCRGRLERLLAHRVGALRNSCGHY